MTTVYYTVNSHDSKEYSNTARLILRYGLTEYGIADAVILKDSRGKPYVADRSDIYISITHTNGCIACAVSDQPVGIDAQMHSKVYLKIAEKMFTEGERVFIGSDAERFFDVWTKKESFAKMTGDGITHNTCNINVISGYGTDGAVFTPIDIDDVSVYICTKSADEITVKDLTNTEYKGVIL